MPFLLCIYFLFSGMLTANTPKGDMYMQQRNGVSAILPEEDGILPGNLRAEQLLRLGAGLSRAAMRTAVGYTPDSDFAKAAALTVCGGIASAGGTAILVPECTAVELGAASAAGECSIMLYAGDTHLRCDARGLLPLTDAQEQAICEGSSEQARTEYGSILDGKSLRLLYPVRVLSRLPEKISCLPEISTASPRLFDLAAEFFRGTSGMQVTLQLSADGRRVSVYTERTGWIFYEKLLMLVTMQHLRNGEDAALPYWMPQIAEQIAGRCGQRILRYASRSDGSDQEARQLAADQGFTLDAMILCADFLRYLAEEKPDLERWLAELPPYYTVRRILRTERELDAAARCGSFMQTKQTPEGLRAKDSRGTALLRPSRSGRSLTLLVEAANMETANELAGDITNSMI